MRRARNKIRGLPLLSGAWCTDDETLQEKAQRFFQNLFSSPSQATPRVFKVQNMPQLSEDMVSELLKPVSKDEVSQASTGMHPYKSLGPDGFQGIFFKQFWHIVGDDIHRLDHDAFLNGYFDPSLAETLIALIPKVDCPNSFKDFWPISLCNTIYKLITKVLVLLCDILQVGNAKQEKKI